VGIAPFALLSFVGDSRIRRIDMFEFFILFFLLFVTCLACAADHIRSHNRQTTFDLVEAHDRQVDEILARIEAE
jgi:hypothetical protein